jgi:phage-related protein
VDAVKNHFTEMWDAINGVWEAIKTAAGAAWDWISTKVKAVVDAVVGFVTGIKDQVVDALSSAATWLYNAGKDMINGLLNGAKSILNGIYNWVKTNLFDKITNAVKSLFGIGSPSKVMAGFGMDISEGMAEGIASGQSDVQKELDALVPSQRFASSSSYTLTGADVAPPQVRVYIGDTELRGIVRTEVRREDTGTAAVLLGGVR